MNRYDVFLSVIYVLNGDLDHLQKNLTTTVQTLSQTVTDYEIVVVDNMTDKSKSILLLKKLTNDKNFPNLQVYILNKRIDENIASCIGLDKSLGDFVAILNPSLDDISFMPAMLDEAKKILILLLHIIRTNILKAFFIELQEKDLIFYIDF